MGGRRRTRRRPPAERAPRPLGHERQVDPTILPALVALGYDRSFEELRPRRARRPPGWRAGGRIELDPDAGMARLEEGVAVDSGGNGKGYWPHEPSRRCSAPGTGCRARSSTSAATSRSTVPSGRRSMAGSASPTRDGRAWTLAVLGLAGGAVATSGRDRRRFFGPRGSPSPPDRPVDRQRRRRRPLAVTVVGGEAAEVEAFATALAISTLAESRTLVSRRFGLSALVVPEVGTPTAVGDLPLVAVSARSPGWRRDSPRRSSPRMDHRPRRRTRGLRAADDLSLARTRHEHSTPGAPAAEGAPGLAPDAGLGNWPFDARPPCWGGLARPGSPSRPARSAGSLHGPLASRGDRRRGRRRLALAHARGLVPAAEVDRPEGLAPPALHELRCLRPRTRARARRRD